jgi:hypothetical protein
MKTDDFQKKHQALKGFLKPVGGWKVFLKGFLGWRDFGHGLNTIGLLFLQVLSGRLYGTDQLLDSDRLVEIGEDPFYVTILLTG